MRRIFPWVLVTLLLIFCSSREFLFKVGDSTVKSGVKLLPINDTYRLIAFMDCETHKIGFVQNGSTLDVVIPAIYEDAYNFGYLLYAVKKDGKWGVIDLGGRFYDDNRIYNYRKPIIPCKYNSLTVIDDYTVICEGKRIDVRRLGYGEHQ